MIEHDSASKNFTSFSKGHIPWNKGVKGLSIGMPIGTKFTEEHKKKLSLRKIGITTWNKGVPMRESTKILQRKRYAGKSWVFDTKTKKRIWIEKGDSN